MSCGLETRDARSQQQRANLDEDWRLAGWFTVFRLHYCVSLVTSAIDRVPQYFVAASGALGGDLRRQDRQPVGGMRIRQLCGACADAVRRAGNHVVSSEICLHDFPAAGRHACHLPGSPLPAD
jgi:hypothetical protein